MGVPAVLEANFIHLPNIILEVAAECSGIESIRALLVLSLVYAHVLGVSPMLRLAIVASAVPIAVVSNLFRIVVTVLLTYGFGPVVLDSFIHKFHGTFNFVVALLLLGLVGEALQRRARAAMGNGISGAVIAPAR